MALSLLMLQGVVPVFPLGLPGGIVGAAVGVIGLEGRSLPGGPVVFTAVNALFYAGVGWVFHPVRQKYHTPGCCQECDYDLTGNISGVCPECGTTIESHENGSESEDA